MPYKLLRVYFLKIAKLMWTFFFLNDKLRLNYLKQKKQKANRFTYITEKSKGSMTSRVTRSSDSNYINCILSFFLLCCPLTRRQSLSMW